METITRLEIKLREPNPLFIKWLERWLSDAEARNTKAKYKLREALASLRKYPLPLYTGKECAILRGFGPTLCNLIDEELSLRQNCHQTNKTIPRLSVAHQTDAYQRQLQHVIEVVTDSAKKERPKKITKKAQKQLDLEQEQREQIKLLTDAFNIVLLVDTQETSGKNKRILDETRSYLDSADILHEVRRLTVGDFLWIARDRTKYNHELVLPYIVERKRMDDLASSIRDGRFHEQKHRLRQCGIENVFYLVEDYGDNEHVGLPLDNLEQALVNTQIHSGFTIVRTSNHCETMTFLQNMTKILIGLYKDKMLFSADKCSLQPTKPNDAVVHLLKFRALYEDSARSAQLTVREVFVQQLLQLHSLSMEKALAIVERYPTPRLLIDAYDTCATESEAKAMLASLPCGKLQRPIGEKVSEALYLFYKTEF